MLQTWFDWGNLKYPSLPEGPNSSARPSGVGINCHFQMRPNRLGYFQRHHWIQGTGHRAPLGALTLT